MNQINKSNSILTATTRIMKRAILLIIIMIYVCGGYSQTIALTFNSKNSLTQNLMSLDSINIQNLAENLDTTLYKAVSVFSLKIINPTSIGAVNSIGSESFIVKQNEPNPFNGNTLVRIFLKNAGKLNLAVYNNHGNKLCEYSNVLGKGWHLFAIATSETHIPSLCNKLCLNV